VSRREAIELGVQAQAVLDNPAMQRAVVSARERYVKTWVSSEPGEHDVREHAYLALRALDALMNELTILLDNGTLAAQQIEREESRNGR